MATWPVKQEDARREGPPGSYTFTIEDHKIDHVSVLDPETGLMQQRSVKATDEEIRQREIDSLQRSLAGIPHRLENIGEHFSFERPPSAEVIEERRVGLEAERKYIEQRLAEMETPEPDASQTAQRRVRIRVHER